MTTSPLPAADRSGAARTRPGTPQAVAAHRRAQRLPVGGPREKPARDLDQARHQPKPQPSIMTDIPRLRAGGVGGQFWSVYVPVELAGQAAVTATMEQIDIVYSMIRKYPGDVRAGARRPTTSSGFSQKGRIASLIGMEGGHSIDNSLADAAHVLQARRALHDAHPLEERGLGRLGDRRSAKLGGLSPFGEEVVREMNWLGMLVDLSHVSPDTMDDAIRVSAGARDLLALRRAGAERRPAQRARQHPAAAAEERRRRDGHVRARLPVAEGRRMEHSSRRRAGTPDRAIPGRRRGGEGRRRMWTKAHPCPARHGRRRRRPHRPHPEDRRASTTSGSAATSTASRAWCSASRMCRPIRRSRPNCCAAATRTTRSGRFIGGNILRVMREAEKVSKRLQSERGPSTLLFEGK